MRVGRGEGRSEGWGLEMGPVYPPGYTQIYKKYSAEGALGERVAILSEITVYLG